MPQIRLEQLDTDPHNANVCSTETLEKIERNILRTGYCPPFIVRPHPQEKDRFIVIDGHHRKLILERLGWVEVDCQIWDVGEEEAKIALLTLNQLRGTDNLKKRAELIESLTQSFSLEDLTNFIPESLPEIEDLLQLLSLDIDNVQTQLEMRQKEEEALLPIVFTFLLMPDKASIVEQALQKQAQCDRTEALFRICQAVMEEVAYDQTTRN